MEATMKANGLKIKNQEKSVKNLIIIKISYTQDHIPTTKNQVKVNYLIFKNKRSMKETFQTIKKKVSSKYFKKTVKYLDLTADKIICKETKNKLGN